MARREGQGQRIGVLVLHGVGQQAPDFGVGMIRNLRMHFAARTGLDERDASEQLVIQRVHWAPVLEEAEWELWRRITSGQELGFPRLRRFLVDYAADAIAYQRHGQGQHAYESVQRAFAEALRSLARQAGQDAPLCIIAHSLGCVIASDFMWDLEHHVAGKRSTLADSAREVLGDSAMERGETFAYFYTLGCPIAYWTLRFDDFGTPIAFPPPALAERHRGLRSEWVNFYDPEDVIGSPLRGLSEAYRARVTADVPVQSGGAILTRTPIAHADHLFWVARGVAERIGTALARAWCQLNHIASVPALSTVQLAWVRGMLWLRRLGGTLDLARELRLMRLDRAPIGQVAAGA